MHDKDKTIIDLRVEVPTYLVPLYQKGYRLAEAARAVGCSHGHLKWVLMGKRTASPELSERLNALPKKQLQLVLR